MKELAVSVEGMLPQRDVSESFMYVDHMNDEPLEANSFSGRLTILLLSRVQVPRPPTHCL